MKNYFLSLVCLFCFSTLCHAQLTIIEGNNITLANLLQELVGEGATIQNIKIRAGGVDISTLSSANATSARQMYGLYQVNGANEGVAPNSLVIPTGADQLKKGLVLCTGNVANIPNVSTAFMSVDKNLGGDPHIPYQFPYPAKDAISIEFDVYPSGDVLGFNYTFASEEYPTYACAPSNDQFRFLVTGANPLNPNQPYNKQNVAVIPNTVDTNGNNGTVVSINNVHSGGGINCNPTTLTANVQYHDPTASNLMVFNQRTKALYAYIPVFPNQKYTLYMVIADIADPVFDSGVFIEKVMAPAPTWIAADSTVLSQAQGNEGAELKEFKLKRTNPLISETLVINAIGSAKNGTDYELLDVNNVPITNFPINVTFGIEEMEKIFTLKVKNDQEEEANESIKLQIKKQIASQIHTFTTFEYTILGNESVLGNEPLRKEKIEIYPNPTQDKVWIQIYNLTVDKIELMDMTGKVKTKFDITSLGKNEYEITLKDLPKGVYMLKVSADEGVFWERLVKE